MAANEQLARVVRTHLRNAEAGGRVEYRHVVKYNKGQNWHYVDEHRKV